MPGSYKTEAIVLRSIRYGEADRILHLYSATRGRIGAIAKGSRRPRSRFGGRLEPFFRLDLVLHEGRGDLATVTSARDGRGPPGPALERAGADGGGARAATRCCGCSTPRSRTRPPTTCSAATWRCSTARSRPAGLAVPAGGWGRRPGDGARVPAQAGAGGRLLPRARVLRALRRGGRARRASPGAAGGVVCAACERGGFELSAEAHRFMVEALGQPLAAAPSASERDLRQAERAITRDARAPRSRAAARRRLALLRMEGG